MTIPWRVVSGALAAVCLVLATSVYIVFRSEQKLSGAYGRTYSDLVLAKIRLSHYVEMVDERNIALAKLEEGRGQVSRALALCMDLCRFKTELFCTSLIAKHRVQADSIGPESHGVHAAVCASL